MKIKKPGRQKVRSLLLLVSFAAFPFSILYLSPGPPLMSLKAGVINLSVLVIFSILLSGLIFRRAFCGWICPGGGCQLMAASLNDKRLQRKKRDWIRIILVSVWVLLMLWTVIFRMDSRTLNLGHPGAGRFANSHIRYYLPYIPTVLFMILFVLAYGRRGFCHRGCWIYPLLAASTRVGTWLRTPSLHVKITDPNACNQCQTCTRKCSMSIDVKAHVENRRSLPFHCIQCGICVDSCKRGVLAYAFKTQGARH